MEFAYFEGEAIRLLSSGEDKKYQGNDAFDDAAKFIHSKGSFEAKDLKNKSVLSLIRNSFKHLSGAVDKGLTSEGIKYNVPASMRNALRENVWVFSGMRTYHQLKECSTLLLDDEGNVKPFSQFKKDVLKIDEKYNVRYLEVERQFAVSSSQMAAKWHDFEEDGDTYYLQYRTAGDDKVREDHASLNGTTLPVSDKFWDSYMPPLDWGCRCVAVQVLADKYPMSDSAKAIELGEKVTTRIGKNGENKLAIFRFNPGKERVVFPPKHPYLAKAKSPQEVKEAQQVVTELSKLRDFEVIKSFGNGGSYSEHKEVNHKAKDYRMVKSIGLQMASMGKEVSATPILHFKDERYKEIYGSLAGTKYEHKCPDLLIDGKFYEVESFNGKWNKNKLKHMLSNGLKQSDRVIINNTNGCSDRFIKKIINERLLSKSFEYGITEVWLYEKGKTRLLFKNTAGE